MTNLATGGTGFIGANLVRDWLRVSDEGVVMLNKFTRAGTLGKSVSLKGDGRLVFAQRDVGDGAEVCLLLAEHRPLRTVVNSAAKSHIDPRRHGRIRM